MQVKDQSVIHRNKYTILNNIIKVAITLGCFYFLWIQLKKNEIDFTQIEWETNAKWSIGTIFLLMVINWYLEALRWKISVESFETISIKDAFYSVLGGLTLNWVLPFTVGDVFARMMSRKDKYQTTSAIILNRGLMFMLTLLFGLYSFHFLEQTFLQKNYMHLSILVLLVSVLFFFKKKLSKFFTYFKIIDKRIFIKVTVISILRYFIFTFQFCWLLSIFNNDLDPMTIFAGAGWIFFVRSFIPHLLGGIGLREAASVVFFTSLVSNISTIVLPVFLIWCINTVVPSIVGLIFLWRMKWVEYRNN